MGLPQDGSTSVPLTIRIPDDVAVNGRVIAI